MGERIPTSELTAPLATDEQLITQVSRGDLGAFETLVERYQKSALRAACRFLGDEHEAEDLAQEAFLQVYRHAHRYQPVASFKTWFYTILTNLCRNARKKKQPLYYAELPDKTGGAGRSGARAGTAGAATRVGARHSNTAAQSAAGLHPVSLRKFQLCRSSPQPEPFRESRRVAARARETKSAAGIIRSAKIFFSLSAGFCRLSCIKG